MNLSRSLSRLLSNPKPYSLLRSTTTHISSSSSSFSTSSSPTKRTFKNPPKPYVRPPSSSSSKFPRPSEIPFQSKVANSVQLVGSIAAPVKLETLPDGAYAVSVLVQHNAISRLPQLCVQVIFQGDLAQIAAYHLKENDLVYVTGQLSGDALPSTVEHKSQKAVEYVHGHIRVLANSLYFVQTTCPRKENEVVNDHDNLLTDNSDSANEPNNLGKSANEPNNPGKSPWNDLIDNPQQWVDNREDKRKGMVVSKYPDFKQKITKEALWLNRAPSWVLQKLGGLVFAKSNYTKSTTMTSNYPAQEPKDVSVAQTRNSKKDDLWKSLADDPSRWWDNRAGKLKHNSPDFKHKDSGEALWLDSSTPSWVFPKLPPSSTSNKQDVAHGNATLS